MNENTEEEVVTTPNEEAAPVVAEASEEEVVVDTTAADQLATTPDNNAPQNEVVVCGVSGVEIKEGDEVVAQVVPGTDQSEGYHRIVLVSALSAEEVAALPEGSVKTFPKLN